VAVDLDAAESELYAGVHQRILGEVGYRVDTRVPWVSIVDDPTLAPWHGGAIVAQRFTGGSDADVGPQWPLEPHLERTPAGLAAVDPAATTPAAAHVDAGEAVGLLHASVRVGGTGDRAGLVFRGRGAGAWRCTVTSTGCELQRCGDDLTWSTVATDTATKAQPGRRHHLQITDDGHTIGAHLDGRLLFSGWNTEADRGATEVGVVVGGGASIADLEVHARSVRLPVATDLPGPWAPPELPVVVEDLFDGPARELETTTTPTGQAWERVEGIGTIDVIGPGAKVRADVANPNPDRTIYAIDWHDPGFVDIELDMTPPGTAAGQGEECRAGLVLWQDEQNYLVVNIFLDNLFDGASISTFFRSRGHEDMHDAVWVLVRPVHFGQRCSLRLISDGHRFLSYLGPRPSLHRSFTDVYPDAPPLEINRVGIVINREWGDDTGTVLHRFTARGRPPASSLDA
jgi:hypothetical protein